MASTRKDAAFARSQPRGNARFHYWPCAVSELELYRNVSHRQARAASRWPRSRESAATSPSTIRASSIGELSTWIVLVQISADQTLERLKSAQRKNSKELARVAKQPEFRPLQSLLTAVKTSAN